MYKIGRCVMLAAGWIALSASVFAADEGLTKNQGDAIIRQLGNIQQLLERIERKLGSQAEGTPQLRAAQAVPEVRISISTKGRPTLGPDDAPVTLVEFTDYQCPFCNRFFKDTFSKIKQDFIDSGKVRFVVKDLPLAFHQNARPAAQAAHCAGEQNKFWPMHDKLFENALKLEPNHLPGYAQELGLDMVAFNDCVGKKRHLAAIDKEANEAQMAGIRGTPSFVVGKSAEDIINGVMIRGAQPYQAFEAAINKLLGEAKAAETQKTSN